MLFFKMLKIINKGMTLGAVKHVFIRRIESLKCNEKIVDIFSIEKVWSALKEKLRGPEYDNIEELKNNIKK